MSKLVECVPNFSEGRDKAKVEAIVSAARQVRGVRVLDVEMDPDHHRSVLTFVADPEAALEAAFLAAGKARDLIDLRVHKGEHPRMGAVDVIPFIPVSGTDIPDCVQLAHRLGQRIGRELDIPVYLYDRAATRPARRDLAAVRKGQFEGLRTAIESDPERAPDYGPRRIHPTAGAVAVGARQQIINFNLNLDISDIEAGKAVARTVRASGGGLPALRAKEIALSSGRVQVSTVLTDYKTTSLAVVLDAVGSQAAARGGKIISSEIVGLLPREALMDFAVERLALKGFQPRAQILEERLHPGRPSWTEAAARMLEALSSTDPTPGGGSAAAIAGAMGCALGAMSLGIALRSKKLDPALRPEFETALGECREARERLELLCSEDAAAFEGFMEAAGLPKEAAERGERMQAALLRSAQAPLETARESARGFARLEWTARRVPGSVASDMRCARHLLRCAALCAAENVRVNLVSLRDSVAARRLEAELERVLSGI